MDHTPAPTSPPAVRKRLADPELLDLGLLLREARVRAGLTMPELAARSGVSASHLSRLERGRSHPSAATVSMVLEACGLRIDAVLVPLAEVTLDPEGVVPEAVLAALDFDPVRLTDSLTRAGVPFRIGGALAAVLHGLAMPVPGLTLVLPRDHLEPASDALVPWLTARWVPSIAEFDAWVHREPMAPGEQRWQIDGGECSLVWVGTEADLGPAVPITVQYDAVDAFLTAIRKPQPAVGPHVLPLLPLARAAALDARVARSLRRAVGSAG